MWILKYNICISCFGSARARKRFVSKATNSFQQINYNREVENFKLKKKNNNEKRINKNKMRITSVIRV